MNWNLETEEGIKNSIDWTNQTLAVVKEGGAWIIPRSGMIVRVSHKDKTAHITGHYEPVVARILEAAGWAVTREQK